MENDDDDIQPMYGYNYEEEEEEPSDEGEAEKKAKNLLEGEDEDKEAEEEKSTEKTTEQPEEEKKDTKAEAKELRPQVGAWPCHSDRTALSANKEDWIVRCLLPKFAKICLNADSLSGNLEIDSRLRKSTKHPRHSSAEVP